MEISCRYDRCSRSGKPRSVPGFRSAECNFRPIPAFLHAVLNNQAGAYSVPNTLDFSTPTLNQQFRVDIITTAANPFSVAGADVLQNLYQTNVGDPLTSGYALVSVNVTALLKARGGQTLRLRFAEADNVNIFHAGVDQVSLSEVTVPEPSTMFAGFAIRRRGPT